MPNWSCRLDSNVISLPDGDQIGWASDWEDVRRVFVPRVRSKIQISPLELRTASSATLRPSGESLVCPAHPNPSAATLSPRLPLRSCQFTCNSDNSAPV